MGQIGGADLGERKLGQQAVFILTPEAEAESGGGPAGAPPALVRLGAAHRHGDQGGHAAARIKA